MSDIAPVPTPPGHSNISHRVHGWCSKCPGREIWEELHAWRIREMCAQGSLNPAPTPPEEHSG